MRNNSDKTRFLKALEEIPLILSASKKSGVPRSTVYRWREKDFVFREKMDKILSLGRSDFIDIAEMSLLKEIKNGNMKAISFFLMHNSERYHKKSEILLLKDPDPEIKIGETCNHCGQEKSKPMSDHQREVVGKAVSKYLSDHPHEKETLFL